MADSLELIVHVRLAPRDNAGELAGWLGGELLELDVHGVDRLPATAVTAGSAQVTALLLVRLDPKALQVVLAKVADWMARSDRVVEISAGGHTLKPGPPARQQLEKAIDGSPAAGTEASRVRPEGEAGAAMEVTWPVVPNGDSAVVEPGKALVPLRSRESLPATLRSRPDGKELSRRIRLADVRLLVKGKIDIEALAGQEFRRTAAFAGISSLLGGGLAALLSIANGSCS